METRAASGAVGGESSRVRAKQSAGGDGGSCDSGGTSGGLDDSGVARHGLTKRSSCTRLAGLSEKHVNIMNISRVNALGESVNKHCDGVYKLLLSSKESLEKRATIEAAFRSCKEAFMEVSTALVGLLAERTANPCLSTDDIKRVLEDVLVGSGDSSNLTTTDMGRGLCGSQSNSYASAVASAGSRVRVPRGPTVELSESTSFLVVPDERCGDKFTSSLATKDTLCRVLKTSECGLRVEGISLARNNGVRIKASAMDLSKIKAHPGLAEAGLKIQANVKQQPRLIVHGIPVKMNSDDIKNELIAQNLKEDQANEIKVIYIYPPKQNRSTTSCVLEVSPAVRKDLFGRGRVYLRFSSCYFADHVRILQCFRCLAFGHFAKDCKAEPACGRCAGVHETRVCSGNDNPLRCQNCLKKYGPTAPDGAHSALDAKKCPILGRKIKDKIENTNYG